MNDKMKNTTNNPMDKYFAEKQAVKAKKNEIMKDLIHLCLKHKIKGFTYGNDDSGTYIDFDDYSNINIGYGEFSSVEFAHYLMWLDNENE